MNRRTVAGLCLIASPALHIVSYFFWPTGSEGSAATQLAAAGNHPASMAAAALIETIGWALLLPALAVLWQEVRGRGAALVGLGVGGTVIGILGFTCTGVLNLVTIALARAPQGLAAFTAVKNDALITTAVLLPILIGEIALTVLFAGLARAALGGWWLPAAVAVAAVADQLTAETGNPVITSAAFLPAAAALTATGLRLVSGRPRAAGGDRVDADRPRRTAPTPH